MTKTAVTGRVAMGIDASLTGTGLVAVPCDWKLDWSKVARMKLGVSLSNSASEEDHVRRIDTICTRAMEFAREHAVTDVFLEEYAFNMADRSRAHALGELGGNLKRDIILDLGLPLTVVVASTARALLGKFSAHRRKGAPKPLKVKDQVAMVLARAGLPLDWDADETDAWVVANWGLSGIDGADAIILREAA
jgi:hypothetical protein